MNDYLLIIFLHPVDLKFFIRYLKEPIVLKLHWKNVTAINKQVAAIYNQVTCFGGSLQCLLLKLYKSTLLTYVGNINPVSWSKNKYPRLVASNLFTQ